MNPMQEALKAKMIEKGLSEADAAEIAKSAVPADAVEVDKLAKTVADLKGLLAKSAETTIDKAVHEKAVEGSTAVVKSVAEAADALAKGADERFAALSDVVVALTERVVELAKAIEDLKSDAIAKTAELSKSFDGLKDHINAPAAPKGVVEVVKTPADLAADAAAKTPDAAAKHAASVALIRKTAQAIIGDPTKSLAARKDAVTADNLTYMPGADLAGIAKRLQITLPE